MIIKYIYSFIVLLLLLGCKSLVAVTDGEEIPASSFSLDNISSPEASNSNLNLELSDTKFKREAEALIKSEKKNLEDYYKNYLDSVRTKLLDSGTVKIKGYEDFLVDILSDEIKNDTVYLSNLYTETNNKGTPLSFQYDALQNDIFFFEIECMRLNGLSKLVFGGVDVEFLEGEQTRFQHFNLSKQDKVSGSFKVIADNPVVFNIVKKGYSKASLKVTIKKVLGTNLIVERTKDSIEEVRTVIREISDTLYHLIDEKQYTLAPQLDLTKGHEVEIPLIVNELDNVIGWGFWIGLNKSDSENYRKLSEVIAEEPLLLFAKTELTKTASGFSLPHSDVENLKVKFFNNSQDTLSLNSFDTYRFFKSDSLSNKSKGKLTIKNNSKLYDQLITLKSIAVNIKKSKIQEEQISYKRNEYITISLIK